MDCCHICNTLFSKESHLNLSQVISKRRLCASFLPTICVPDCTDWAFSFPYSGKKALLPLQMEVLKGEAPIAPLLIQLWCFPFLILDGLTRRLVFCIVWAVFWFWHLQQHFLFFDSSYPILNGNECGMSHSFLLLTKENSCSVIRQVFRKLTSHICITAYQN